MTTMNVYHAVKYLLHNFVCMLMNLVTDADGIPIDKAIDSSSLNIILQTYFTELHVDEIEDTISYEPSIIEDLNDIRAVAFAKNIDCTKFIIDFSLRDSSPKANQFSCKCLRISCNLGWSHTRDSLVSTNLT